MNRKLLAALAGGAIVTGAIGLYAADGPLPIAIPLPGITAKEKNLFDLGLEDFSAVDTEEDGLGPAYNGQGCASCHSLPRVGGAGNMTVLRAGKLVNGVFQEINGGSLIHLFSIPDFSCQPSVPAEANVRARRLTTSLLGAGLLEAIPDSAILSRHDPDDKDGDGIRGRAAYIVEPGETQRRIGRFGWKNQHATLFAFGADAYLNEMGITNDLFPKEFAVGLTPEQLSACDTVADPEDRRDPANGNLRAIDLFAGFMKFLAPMERGEITAEARRGEAVFADLGCARCHTPSMNTGDNPSAALNRKEVRAYTDLLLHDIGTGDGIAQADAKPNEFRTAPLWGLRTRRLQLHDGSAVGPEEAIAAHKGEANASRERYEALSEGQKADLIAFLNSL